MLGNKTVRVGRYKIVTVAAEHACEVGTKAF